MILGSYKILKNNLRVTSLWALVLACSPKVDVKTQSNAAPDQAILDQAPEELEADARLVEKRRQTEIVKNIITNSDLTEAQKTQAIIAIDGVQIAQTDVAQADALFQAILDALDADPATMSQLLLESATEIAGGAVELEDILLQTVVTRLSNDGISGEQIASVLVAMSTRFAEPAATTIFPEISNEDLQRARDAATSGDVIASTDEPGEEEDTPSATPPAENAPVTPVVEEPIVENNDSGGDNAEVGGNDASPPNDRTVTLNLSYSNPTSSPGVVVTPRFTVTLAPDESFFAGDTVTLHQNAGCTGAAVPVSLSPATIANDTSLVSATLTVPMNIGTRTFFAKLTDGDGDESCSSAPLTYEYSPCGSAEIASATIALGNGTGPNPYIVCNAEQLQSMNQDLDAYYELGRNIDASETGLGSWEAKNGELNDNGSGFLPIGSCGANYDCSIAPYAPFEGSFHGNGFTISDLTMNRGRPTLGFFGRVSQRAVITDLRLTNATITHNGAGPSQEGVGGIFGTIASPTFDLYFEGDVTGDGYSTGGIAGEGSGMSQVEVNATVVGGSYSGGIAGQVDQSPINNAYARGSVNGSGYPYVGGIVGYTTGAIRDTSFAGSAIGAGNNTGGIVGVAYGDVVRATSSGTVTGANSTGGVIGRKGIGGVLVEDMQSTSTVSGGNKVGGVVGHSMLMSIFDAHHTGPSVSGVNQVGGVAGHLDGNAELQRASATSIVSGTDKVGGLVGHAYQYNTTRFRTIADAFATGNVTGTNDVGGLVGYSRYHAESQIVRSFATGDVNGTNNVGGFMGSGEGASFSFSTGSVTAAGSNVGGFAGFLVEDQFDTVAWFDAPADNGTSCFNDGDGASNVQCTTETIADLQNPSNTLFNQGGNSWNFSTIWQVNAGAFPTLRTPTYAAPTLAGSGTKADPFLLGSGDDWALILQTPEMMSAYYRLIDSFSIPATQAVLGTENMPFSGTIDGDGLALINVTIEQSGTNNIGLFAYGEGAHIHDLAIINATVDGFSRTGTLFGQCENCLIRNVDITSTVTGDAGADSVGGIIGQAWDCQFIRVSWNGMVSGNQNVGGVAGNGIRSSFRMVQAFGTVTAAGVIAGGITGGGASIFITDSQASGNVSASGIIGGIIGSANSVHIQNSTSTAGVGGGGTIVGSMNAAGVVLNVFSAGIVGSTSIVASVGGGTITNSYHDDDPSTFFNATHPVFVGTPAWDLVDTWSSPAAAAPNLR